ncbi:MAG: DUF6603 domain-containing protein, partial [Vicinamibacterales bacterium]
IDIDGSLSVSYRGNMICSVGVCLSLSGPAPWHALGEVSVGAFGVSATVRIEATVGSDELPPAPEPVPVMALLQEAITHVENWTAQPPEGDAVVTLRSRPEAAQVSAHPLASLTFSQRVTPLGIEIDRYGAAPIEGERFFAIETVGFTGTTLAGSELEEVRDAFAPGQFFALSEAEQLSRPSFESLPSGIIIRCDEYDVDELAAAEAAPFGYELLVVDEEEDGSAPGTILLEPTRAVSLARSGPAAAARARHSGLRRFQAPAAAIAVLDRVFAVAGPDGKVTSTGTRTTFTEAADVLRGVKTTGDTRSIVRVRERA